MFRQRRRRTINLTKLKEHLTSKYHLESLWLLKKKDTIVIQLISVEPKKRGKGYGSKAMQALTTYADQWGLTLALIPSGQYGSNPDRLTQWYASMGFVGAPVYNHQMIRLPR